MSLRFLLLFLRRRRRLVGCGRRRALLRTLGLRRRLLPRGRLVPVRRGAVGLGPVVWVRRGRPVRLGRVLLRTGRLGKFCLGANWVRRRVRRCGRVGVVRVGTVGLGSIVRLRRVWLSRTVVGLIRFGTIVRLSGPVIGLVGLGSIVVGLCRIRLSRTIGLVGFRTVVRLPRPIVWLIGFGTIGLVGRSRTLICRRLIARTIPWLVRWGARSRLSRTRRIGCGRVVGSCGVLSGLARSPPL